MEKYRNLLKKTKQARVGQIILSGILPVFGNRIDGYRNSKRMAVNGMVKRLGKEEEVGYVDLWDSFMGKEEMYARGSGAAVFAEGLSGAGGLSKKAQPVQEGSRCKGIQGGTSKEEIKCVCINARSIIIRKTN